MKNSKDRKDFVMISLSLDKSVKEPREFLKKNELPWLQAYLGEWSQTKVPSNTESRAFRRYFY